MKYYQVGEWDPGIPYIFNGICFDPRDGSGGTPNAGNITYMGVVLFVSPEIFLRCVHPLVSERDGIAFWKDQLPKQTWCISPPQLMLDKEDGGFRVVGHEGRHRTTALLQLGKPLVPIYVTIRGLRSRNIDEELLERISPVVSETGKYTTLIWHYLVLQRRVLVKSQDKLSADRKEWVWNRIRPIPVETENVIIGDGDWEYYGSRPK